MGPSLPGGKNVPFHSTLYRNSGSLLVDTLVGPPRTQAPSYSSVCWAMAASDLLAIEEFFSVGKGGRLQLNIVIQ